MILKTILLFLLRSIKKLQKKISNINRKKVKYQSIAIIKNEKIV